MAHRLNCSVACGVFPDQGSNLCPLHCKADKRARILIMAENKKNIFLIEGNRGKCEEIQILLVQNWMDEFEIKNL